MTVAELLRGPDQVDGPAAGVWDLTGRPIAGLTPKFTIRDARGDTYMLKFDPATNPELPSSVERSRPSCSTPSATTCPRTSSLRSPTTGSRRAHRTSQPRGATPTWTPWRPGCGALRRNRTARIARTRAAGSQAPSSASSSTGPAVRRPERPVPARTAPRAPRHARVRRLADHDDARAINSIDTYMDEGGRVYIRHYMQDFGSNLGSGSTSPSSPAAAMST